MIDLYHLDLKVDPSTGKSPLDDLDINSCVSRFRFTLSTHRLNLKWQVTLVLFRCKST